MLLRGRKYSKLIFGGSANGSGSGSGSVLFFLRIVAISLFLSVFTNPSRPTHDS